MKTPNAQTIPSHIADSINALLATTPLARQYSAHDLMRALDSLENPKSQPETYLKIPEAAERLRCSKRQVYRLIDAGRLLAVRLGPRFLRIPASCLESSFLKALQSEEA